MPLAAALALLATPTMPFLIGAEWSPSAPLAAKRLFLETGANFVRLTGGGYGWSTAEHVKELEFLRPSGIRTLLQLGSHWPDGKYLDRRDDYFVDQDGKSGERVNWGVGYDGQFWPALSYASDGYRRDLETDFASYLDATRKFKDVVGLLLHNEPGLFWIDGRVFDYNPQAIAKFRTWLSSQHASIADLNRRWGTSFASFAAVDPPRERPPVKNVAAWMDWRRFHVWLMSDFLRWEAAFAKRQRPDLPHMTNLAGPLDSWFPLRLADNYTFAAASDIASVDIYPGEWTDRYFAGFTMDMTQGVAKGRPVVVAECESYDAKRFSNLSEEQRADRLKCDLWTYIGHGARGVLIWSLSGQDGFHLTDGEFNPRVRVLRETAHTTRMIGLDGFQRPRPRVALLVDQDAFLYFGGTMPGRDGGARVQSQLLTKYAEYARRGLPVDIVCADDVRTGKVKPYTSLVLATPLFFDGALAEGLREFVRAGGRLVTDDPIGERDRWGKEVGPNAFGRVSTVSSLSPRSRIDSSDGFVDTGRLRDERGNELLVLANPADKKDVIVPKKDLRITVPFRGEVFAFDDQGARPIGKGPNLRIAQVQAALPLLMAKDHPPLLRMQIPSAAVAGRPVSVSVAVYNPSPRPLKASVGLDGPPDWRPKPRLTAVKPLGSSIVTFALSPKDANPRAVVKPYVSADGRRIDGVPADVAIRLLGG